MNNVYKRVLMKMNFKKEMKKIGADWLILAAGLIYFIVVGVRLPVELAHGIDNVAGKLVLLVMVLLLFLRSPILGILGTVVAFDLLSQAEKLTGTTQERLFLPNDYDKGKVFTALNQFPVTVEQEVVSRMVPVIHE